MRVVNREQVAAEEAKSGGNYVTKSGIYELNLQGIELAQTTNGAVQANYYFDEIKAYGSIILSKEGKELFGIRTIDSLAIIENLEGWSDSPDELEPMTLTTKKGPKEVFVIPEFRDIPVKAHIQFEYSVYNGEIKERVNVKRFYRVSDNATSSEIVEDKGFGTRYEKDLEKYAETTIYKDGLDEEQVKAWKDSFKNGGEGSNTAKPTAESAGFKKPSFGKPAVSQ